MLNASHTDRLREKGFENAVEAVLLSGGPDANRAADTWNPIQRARGPYTPGGYRKREADKAYDRSLCLDAGMLLEFIQTSQPNEWDTLVQRVGLSQAESFLRRDVSREIGSHGLIKVLRATPSLTVEGIPFRLVYFPPSSGLNAAEGNRYKANIFSVMRQVHYQQNAARSDKSLDMVLFLNGIPFATLELKNNFNGQTVEDAMRQYREDRDAKEPLLAPRRCAVHFAVDTETAYMTAELAGNNTVFLPFNQGRDGGAGNPRLVDNYATAYLWEQALARDSVLNLLQHFVYEIERKKVVGKREVKTRHLLFPRYHQIEAVRNLVTDARTKGAGQRYLIQHSAGSGKSNSIGWLAHQLSILHDAKDERVFTDVLVVSDRTNLDDQLRDTVAGFEKMRGTVKGAKDSADLTEALKARMPIIVTTLQKFPHTLKRLAEYAKESAGRGEPRRFAIIIDEAHSSQAGDAAREMNKALRIAGGDEETRLANAEAADSEQEEKAETKEDQYDAETARAVRQLDTASYFAFTATPKPKTRELFGTRQPDGSYKAFHTYTMRQAIEEGFILDVLKTYITYRDYFHLEKEIQDDPLFEKERARRTLIEFARADLRVIKEKVAAMLFHFENVASKALDGQARAMIVTPSRLHAVRYKQAVDDYIAEHNSHYRALIAFSGTVTDAPDGGTAEYTEAKMNGFSDRQTAAKFKEDPYRLLVVANKYQTGFDEPLLCAMYVDKKLRGVAAVQTLSRLNRVAPGKTEVWVLDFENNPEEVQEAFQAYYDRAILRRGTDPKLLTDLQRRLRDFGLFDNALIDSILTYYRGIGQGLPGHTEPGLKTRLMEGVIDEFNLMDEGKRVEFARLLTDYVRLYTFLSQILRSPDGTLEKLYQFARLLQVYLPPLRESLSDHDRAELMRAATVDRAGVMKTGEHSLKLTGQVGDVQPQGQKLQSGGIESDAARRDRLTVILAEINDRFAIPEEKSKPFVLELRRRLSEDAKLRHAFATNPSPQERLLVFRRRVTDLIQDMFEVDFEMYKQINDNPDWAEGFVGYLCDSYEGETGKGSLGH